MKDGRQGTGDGGQVPDSAREPADLEAAAWLIKHDRGLTPAEQDEFLQWLAAAPTHGAWFARHRGTWADFNLLAHWRPEHGATPNPDLLAPKGRRRRNLAFWSSALATAAAVALTAMLWPRANRGWSAEIVASAYEQRVLEDGTIVDLNRGAQLQWRFTPEERWVRLLRGEAQFNVAKNPARPFVVRAGGVDVRAVGTAFNVRFENNAVEVLVTEGRVKLDRASESRTPQGVGLDAPPNEPTGTLAATPAHGGEGSATAGDDGLPELIAGQRAVVSLAADAPAPRVVAASTEDMSRLLAWQPQLLDFDSTPLGDVVVEFNRRNRKQLLIADEELRGIPIVASFRSDNLDGFVRLLEVTAEIRPERRGTDEIVLRKRR